MSPLAAAGHPARWTHPLTAPSFGQLHSCFHSAVAPTPLPAPYRVAFSPEAAALLDLQASAAESADFVALFTGNMPTPGSLATVYAGHQFGVYVPQLGDGRALLLGEVLNARGERWEVQLKGAGKTPYSRFADGRAVLRSSIREFLASEAMAGLGIPTTRALCITGSDEPVLRETPETAAVLTRLAPSHIRFGHFEYFFYRHEFMALAPLANHVIQQHFPQFAELEAPERYRRWLAEVIARSAALVAHWQAVGFCHGVLNTDNMSILGLTLDYGPYGFMEAFDAGHVCNHSDESGRYAYNQQPAVVYWNCSRLVQALLPLLDADPDQSLAIGQALLVRFPEQFDGYWLSHLRAKFGLRDAREQDQTLMNGFLDLLQSAQADYARSFRALATVGQKGGDLALRQEVGASEALDVWLRDYRERLTAESGDPLERAARMNTVNPKFVLRNWLAQRAIERAQHKDFSEIEKLRRILLKPFDEQLEYEDYTQSPPEWARQLSVSCSS